MNQKNKQLELIDIELDGIVSKRKQLEGGFCNHQSVMSLGISKFKCLLCSKELEPLGWKLKDTGVYPVVIGNPLNPYEY